MCVIMYKPKNIDIPKQSFFDNCFKINKDGAGFMFADSDSVIIRKGFESVGALMDSINHYDRIYNLKDKNLIVHFRIATSGGVSKSKCHPFPLTEKTKDLNDVKIKADYGVVHNGILNDYVYGDLSDTQNYIKDFLFPLKELTESNIVEDSNAEKLISKTIGDCKLIILDKKGDVLRLGKWAECDGVYYSNLTYKTNYYTSETEEKKWDYTTYYNNLNWYNKIDSESISFNNDLYYDIVDSCRYKVIPQYEGIKAYNTNNLTEEFKADYYSDLFIDCYGYIYRIEWEYEEAEYLGKAKLFDNEGNELKWSDL